MVASSTVSAEATKYEGYGFWRPFPVSVFPFPLSAFLLHVSYYMYTLSISSVYPICELSEGKQWLSSVFEPVWSVSQYRVYAN